MKGVLESHLESPIFFSLGHSRGSPPGVAFVNFKPDMFSFLNITSLSSDLVDDNIECGFSCLEIPSCFSYNVAAFADINGKLLCELLPSDKFNNSGRFTSSPFHHHFSITVGTKLYVKRV